MPSPMQLRLDRRILGLIWARADDELTDAEKKRAKAA
jgi:hypothetical protein